MEATPYPAILREARCPSPKRRIYWYTPTYKYCTIEGNSALAGFPT